MKISPILAYSSKFNILKQNKILHSATIGNSRDIQNVDFSCAVPFLSSSNYKYKAISSKVQNYSLTGCQYENTDEFAELYVNKLNSQLLTIEKKDVENLINRIKLKTKAPDSLIKEVLYNLTVLSGYSAINYFGALAKKYSTV